MRIGEGCTFYHEGGRGERRWVVGWRYGTIRALPTKGKLRGWAHIELPVRIYAEGKLRPLARVWVPLGSVNRPGDYLYHGNEGLAEAVEERKEVKAKQQKKADKKKAPPKRRG